MRAAQKVRLMHAAIRHLIRESTENAPNHAPREMGDVLLQMNWPAKDEELGKPLHQLSMSMAILSFSYIVLRSLKKLGINLSPIQEKAYLYRWNIIAQVMDVEPDLRLNDKEPTMDEAEEMYAAIWPPAVGGAPHRAARSRKRSSTISKVSSRRHSGR